MFSDIEQSTRRAEELGDDAWMRLLGLHNSVVRRQVERHGGHEVKAQGDGFMLAFPSARAAVLFAIDVKRTLDAHGRSQPADLLRMRIGMHTGEAIVEDGDLFGHSVVLAARIADQARGGEILVSSLVREIVESRGDLVLRRHAGGRAEGPRRRPPAAPDRLGGGKWLILARWRGRRWTSGSPCSGAPSACPKPVTRSRSGVRSSVGCWPRSWPRPGWWSARTGWSRPSGPTARPPRVPAAPSCRTCPGCGRAIGAEHLVTRDNGYVLVLDGASYDAAEFEARLAEARQLVGDEAVAAYDAALGAVVGPGLR